MERISPRDLRACDAFALILCGLGVALLVAAGWTVATFPDRALRCAALGVCFAALGAALQLRVRQSARSGEPAPHGTAPQAEDPGSHREPDAASHPTIARAARILAWVLAILGAGACSLAALEWSGVGRRGPRMLLMGVAFLALAWALFSRLRADAKSVDARP